MSNMKKIILIIVAVLLVICVGAYKTTSFNPHHITIRTETLSSNKIDSSLNGTRIIYFTDLHFGEYTKEEDVKECINLINKLDPDVVVFGGDLIDNYSQTKITQDQRQFLIKNLKNIKASQAKYYLLGNHDLENETSIEDIQTIFLASDFFPLSNANYKIHNKTNSYFNIVGIDSLIGGNPNITDAYSNIDNSKYTIAFTHCPDLFDDLPLDKTDYVIAGHSHGGQIYIPILNNLYRANGCNKYFHGKHNKNATTLDISNGVGLTSYSIRFQANAEIVFYKLMSK